MTVHNSLANRSERDGKRGRASGVEFPFSIVMCYCRRRSEDGQVGQRV